MTEFINTNDCVRLISNWTNFYVNFFKNKIFHATPSLVMLESSIVEILTVCRWLNINFKTSMKYLSLISSRIQPNKMESKIKSETKRLEK